VLISVYLKHSTLVISNNIGYRELRRLKLLNPSEFDSSQYRTLLGAADMSHDSRFSA
jgi:hypothetical protein